MKIQSDETLLEVAERIHRLVTDHLVKVAVDAKSGGWDTLFRDPDDGRFWELIYPQGYMHGGGPPQLRWMTDLEVMQKYGISQYSVFDPILDEWARDNTLYVGKEFKECEVRSIAVVSQRGQEFQIWLEPPKGEATMVHVWDFKDRRHERRVDSLKHFRPALDEALFTAKAWMTPPE